MERFVVEAQVHPDASLLLSLPCKENPLQMPPGVKDATPYLKAALQERGYETNEIGVKRMSGGRGVYAVEICTHRGTYTAVWILIKV